MPRRPRSDLPEVGAYHVASRGTNHGDIYLDGIDRKSFMTILGRVVATHGWNCHAFCLMTTHYHLIVETERWKLSRGMQVLNGRYAQRFNQRHDRDGHLFRGLGIRSTSSMTMLGSRRAVSTFSRTGSGRALPRAE